jgi:hypothetical protein
MKVHKITWGRTKSRIMASGLSCMNPVDVATPGSPMPLQCNGVDMCGGQHKVASATYQSGAISVVSCRQAVGDQIAFECGLAVDGLFGKCGASGQIWAWGADLVGNPMPLENFCSRVGNAQNIPGLWRVEYLLSNHSSKSITAAT